MQWHSVTFNLFVSAAFLVLGNQSASAVDESLLWLPKSHENQQVDLVRAAQVAEELDRCTAVLDGTLDADQSKPGRPIYRILCRQSDGRSYNEMVDGITFETLTTIMFKEKKLTPEEQALKNAEAAAELVKRTAEAWDRCDEKIKYATRSMIDMVVLTQGRPEPTNTGPDERAFTVLFDAKSIRGEQLHYKAVCKSSLNDAIDKVVIKRRDAA